MEYQNIITIEPGKRGGKPCIRGFRDQVQAAGGGNYQTLINDVLSEYIQQRREP